ncbi:MAG: dephospho-CoA kinase, partial [Muribaculaceae bacterium]|nr:dephospho-CoA kinase [Muribaculaceae bacterium]
WIREYEARFTEEKTFRGWGKHLFIESAILHSSGLDERCSEIWLVDAPENVRKERALKRGGIKDSDLQKRIASQKREFDGLNKEKIKVIDNAGDEALLTQIVNLLGKYVMGDKSDM